MKLFIAALRFLTILPLPFRAGDEEKQLGRSVRYFPVVGLLIGLAVAFLDAALLHIFPPAVSSMLIVIALVAVSGGLHIDGLADTADGFFSSRPKEQMLEIMRDSRIGPMGVVAIVCLIGLKMVALTSISSDLRWGTILMMPLAGRCALAIMLTLMLYARPEGGLVTAFQQNPCALNAFLAAGTLVCVGWIMGTVGLAMAVVALVGTLVVAAYSLHKIGGMTGDTLGASCEIVEALPAIVAVVAAHVM